MGALLSPDRRNQKGIKWLLVAHTVALFSLVTVSVVTSIRVMVVAAIENREFPGAAGRSPPGIFGYYEFTSSTPITVVSNVTFFLNGLLADGLLVCPASNPVHQASYINAPIALSLSCHLCHEPLGHCLPMFVIYIIRWYVSVFPLKFLVRTAVDFRPTGTGIMRLFEESHQFGTYWYGSGNVVDLGPIYLCISLSLNVLLTLMIIVRLVLHNRTIRNAMGSQSTPNGLTSLEFVNTILIESCAPYTLISVSCIALWITNSYIANYILPIFEASQVRACHRLTAILEFRWLISGD